MPQCLADTPTTCSAKVRTGCATISGRPTAAVPGESRVDTVRETVSRRIPIVGRRTNGADDADHLSGVMRVVAMVERCDLANYGRPVTITAADFWVPGKVHGLRTEDG